MRDAPEGDPRVLFATDALLSAGFAYLVLRLSDAAGLTSFAIGRFVGFTLVLMLAVHFATR